MFIANYQFDLIQFPEKNEWNRRISAANTNECDIVVFSQITDEKLKVIFFLSQDKCSPRTLFRGRNGAAI